MSQLTDLDVPSLRVRYMLEFFIETGCWMGDGIATALAAGFCSVESCDINPQNIEHCRHRFGTNGSVTLYEGESVQALARMCERATGPTLFWLDAHYPAHYDLPEEPDTWFPLWDELLVIKKHKAYSEFDVIAFDDLRVINSADNPRWREGEVPPYYVYNERSLTELTSPFSASHELLVSHGSEGIGILCPKHCPLGIQERS